MWRLLAWGLALCFLIGAITFVVVGLAVAAPPAKTAAQAFRAEQCTPQPCWRGVRIGQTSRQQAARTLNAGYEYKAEGHPHCWGEIDTPCWYYSVRGWGGDNPITEIEIQPAAGQFLMQDALLAFGSPLTAQLCLINGPSAGNVDSSVPRPLMIGYFTFSGGVRLVAINRQAPLSQRLSPLMEVHRLYYQPSGYEIYTPRWHGFALQRVLGCSR
jgi:hypothetical protein